MKRAIYDLIETLRRVDLELPNEKWFQFLDIPVARDGVLRSIQEHLAGNRERAVSLAESAYLDVVSTESLLAGSHILDVAAETLVQALNCWLLSLGSREGSDSDAYLRHAKLRDRGQGAVQNSLQRAMIQHHDEVLQRVLVEESFLSPSELQRAHANRGQRTLWRHLIRLNQRKALTLFKALMRGYGLGCFV